MYESYNAVLAQVARVEQRLPYLLLNKLHLHKRATTSVRLTGSALRRVEVKGKHITSWSGCRAALALMVLS